MLMRVRLRAPEEDAADARTTAAATTASSAAATAASAWPSAQHRELQAEDTAPARRLPPLDVRTPELIEQRLENLKRRPTWRAWLDEYVRAHPESDESDDDTDDDDDDDEEQETHTNSSTNAHHHRLQQQQRQRVPIDRSPRVKSAADDAGFVRTTLWSLVIVAIAPLLLVLYPCLRSREKWPLGCRSLPALVLHAVSTLLFMLFGAALVYYAVCRELPELNANAATNVQARLHEMQQTASVCRASAFQGDLALFQEMCMPIAIDSALLLLSVWLVFHSHRKWAKYALVLVAGLFVVDMPAKLYEATFPAPDIALVDPSYALVDEELLVALEGKNLKPGGSVAWVAYWGCASTSPVESCEKQFHSTFDVGVVRVTFTSLDHFIPCYRDPPNPLKVQEYRCFERIRLRVKDKQSIPGWSKVRGSAGAGEQQPLQQQRVSEEVTQERPESVGDSSTTAAGSQQQQVPKRQQTTKQQGKKSTRTQKRKTKGVKTVSVALDGEAAQD